MGKIHVVGYSYIFSTAQFVVIDRGMGVVSLRSNKFPKVWLCVKQSKVQGNVS